MCKAYTTRVGAGVFPTEEVGAAGDLLRERGHEYGTTTGRPRRCGWFDAVAGEYSARLAGATQIAMMHLDTLTGLERIGICTGYETTAGRLPGMISDVAALQEARPVLEYLPGWNENISDARSFDQLPRAARNYVDRVGALMGAPITIVSVGPERTQTLFRS